MADSGGGQVATDDCGAAGQAQIVKLAVAADGSAVVLPADAANGLAVDVTRQATGQGKALKFAAISTDGTIGDKTIVAAVAGTQIKVVSYVLVVPGATNVRWFSGAAGTALSGAMSLAANGSVGMAGQPSAHLLQTAVGAALVLNVSAAVVVSGHLAYFEEA